jgi:hypothetical protein
MIVLLGKIIFVLVIITWQPINKSNYSGNCSACPLANPDHAEYVVALYIQLNRVLMRFPGVGQIPHFCPLTDVCPLQAYSSPAVRLVSIFVNTQHNQFTAGLSRFGPAGTSSQAS